jgi:beta-glucosidase-like glycosyl hydrolase/CubicO group peptidase (beta-lactamase class C family)
MRLMRRVIKRFDSRGLLAMALVSGLVAGGCGGPANGIGPGPFELPADWEPRLLSAPDAAGSQWVDRTLEELTLQEAVGQLVFPWIEGAYWADDDPEFLEAIEWVEEWGIGGVAISIGTPHAYAAKLNALQERAALPLMVTSDFENGGPGMRINHSYALPSLLSQGGGTSFPPTMAFGAVDEEGIVEEFARITAREARAVGVHVTFAPVVDVNSNPENPIINTRAFGEDPLHVARLGQAYIRGAREGGILTTAKHFPGHGDTRVDSHLTLPEVTADRSRLDEVELVPFQAAVDEGVDAVMTAHVSVPEILGAGAPPATMAPEFMTALLREEMGFTGLLFTDALRMGAITEGYGAGEAAVLALEAGADVILIPESVPLAVLAIVEAVEEGRVTRERIDDSVRRILLAKARLELHRNRMVSLDAVSSVVGIGAHREVADRAAAESVTLPRDAAELVPLDPERVTRVLSLTYAVPEDLAAGREFDVVLAGLLPQVEAVRIGPDAREEELRDLVQRAASFDVVLVNAYVPPRAGAGTVALPDPVLAFVRDIGERVPTVLISLGNPYLLNSVPDAGTYLIAWGDREVSQRAAARAVAGATRIEGRLPITLPGLHQRGEGLVREAIPEVAARAEERRDALDEAGLLRRSDPDDPEDPDDNPGDADPETGAPTAPADTVGAGNPGLDRPSVPPPPHAPEAPVSWRELPVSPLEVDAALAGMDPEALEVLDTYILESIADSVAPGAVLAIGRGGSLVRLRGYGRLDWDPESPAATPFSLYDVASLTKTVATTTGVMLLLRDGRIGLDDPVVQHLPGFDRGDPRKSLVTVRHLLLHQSGLPAYQAFHASLRGDGEVREAVFDLPLTNPPGTTTTYSDIGFITLGWVVEAAAGERLDALLRRDAFEPLGMLDTDFLPDPAERARTAPTERLTSARQYPIHGEVHDENAHIMGGIAGHAGIFSTAQDLAVFAQFLLDRGTANPCMHQVNGGAPCAARTIPLQLRLIPESLVSDFTRRADPEISRTLGWDTPSGRSSAGDYFSGNSFGHTGFTGTSIWIDPDLELFVVLLTNRVNPTSENDRHISFRREVHDRVAGAVADRVLTPRESDGP